VATKREPGARKKTAAPAHPLARRPRQTAARPARRPLPGGEQFFTPGATGVRRAVETRSATLLVFLYQMPRWVLPVVMVALLITGLALPDWRGGVATLPVLALVAWLSYLSWPSLRPGGRLLRVALATFALLLALDRFGLF
jgi:hypothetical protein